MDPLEHCSHDNPGHEIISSRSVIWQGEDIPCINLCKGDKIDTVISKLALLLCSSGSVIDISDVNMKCLLEAYATRPTSVIVLLQLIIDKVCTVAEAVGNLNGGFESPVLFLPVGLQYTDGNGQLVTQLEHTLYSRYLAERIVSLYTLINQMQLQITALDSRLDAIDTILANLPTGQMTLMVSPGCVGNGNGDDIPVTQMVTALENLLCQYRSVLGEPSEVALSVTRQCVSLGSELRLSGNGIMSSIPNWEANATTMSDAITNLWLTVCDMRAKMDEIGTNNVTGFESVILDFEATLIEDRTKLFLKTYGKTIIPPGFNEVAGATKLTIYDGVNTHVIDMNLTAFNLLVLGNLYEEIVLASLPSPTINGANSLKVTLDAVFAYQGTTCPKTKFILLPNGCVINPVSNMMSAANDLTATVSWTAPANIAGANNYITKLYKKVGGTWILKQSVSVPITMPSNNYQGLEVSSDYRLDVSVDFGVCGISTIVTTLFTTLALGGVAVSDEWSLIVSGLTPGTMRQVTFKYTGVGGYFETITVQTDTDVDAVENIMTYGGSPAPYRVAGVTSGYSVLAI